VQRFATSARWTTTGIERSRTTTRERVQFPAEASGTNVLDVALKFLKQELNGFLLARTGSDFGQVQIGRFVDDAGKWVIAEDHVGAALINVEEERSLRSQLPEVSYSNGRNVTLEPDLKLNVHVLFAAHFQQYEEALRYLSYVLTYFQSHSVFTPDAYPGLDSQIPRLTAELLPTGYEQLNQIWAFVGAKQLPSIVYRIRLIVIQDAEPAAIQPPITSIDTVMDVL
jgi:hypothetical protein